MKGLILLLAAAPAAAFADAAFLDAMRAGRAAFIEAKHAALSAPPPPGSTVKDKVTARLAGALPAAFVDAFFADPRLRLDMRIPPKFEKPAERLPYEDYRKIFITEERIAAGAAFAGDKAAVLDAVAARYGVEKYVLVALVGVETFYGRNTGAYEVANALYTIADQVPARETFAVRELAEFLKLCRAERLDCFSVNGSYAGAFGLGQFIPSSFNGYAVDWDGDGRRRWDEWPDMLATVASYLKRNGYKPEDPYKAIFAYNHSDNYVKVVLELRQAVKDRRADRRSRPASRRRAK